ncbi:MAG: YidC/Oxa1 family membrane protein insertase, partial [Clostridiales bacterium]|nr:YidC/Oxa1 family membrane protein insertase [Clostridiales bacterium]
MSEKHVHNPALSILILSLVVNFLVLPLYRRADAMQEQEREMGAKMAPWLKHIRKTFKGDERFMMTQTYYRQMGYKQVYVLRSSVPLLLQIPFFIAAYHFLSHLNYLSGVKLGPIKDLA